MEVNLQLSAAVHSVIVVIVNDVFVRFMIMKLKYILNTCWVFSFQSTAPDNYKRWN